MEKQKKTLSKEAFDALFNENAVLIEYQDRLPAERAIQLFGKDALDFAERMNKHDFGGYGIGEYTQMYVTKHGAMLAATYNNIVILAANKSATKAENRQKEGV